MLLKTGNFITDRPPEGLMENGLIRQVVGEYSIK